MPALTGSRIGRVTASIVMCRNLWNRFRLRKPENTCKPSCGTPTCTRSCTALRKRFSCEAQTNTDMSLFLGPASISVKPKQSCTSTSKQALHHYLDPYNGDDSRRMYWHRA